MDTETKISSNRFASQTVSFAFLTIFANSNNSSIVPIFLVCSLTYGSSFGANARRWSRHEGYATGSRQPSHEWPVPITQAKYEPSALHARGWLHGNGKCQDPGLAASDAKDWSQGTIYKLMLECLSRPLHKIMKDLIGRWRIIWRLQVVKLTNIFLFIVLCKAA